jgi:hypothetical protein
MSIFCDYCHSNFDKLMTHHLLHDLNGAWLRRQKGDMDNMAITGGLSHLKPRLTWSLHRNQQDLRCAPGFEIHLVRYDSDSLTIFSTQKSQESAHIIFLSPLMTSLSQILPPIPASFSQHRLEPRAALLEISAWCRRFSEQEEEKIVRTMGDGSEVTVVLNAHLETT